MSACKKSVPVGVPSAPSDAATTLWRSLKEFENPGAYRKLLHNEFPPGASELNDKVSRRSFLKVMSASLALAGLNACTRQPIEPIVPYVRQPEELKLGEPLFFATAMPLGGFGTGVLVKSREGRPIKVEGNPLHPASLGGSSIFMQAAILDLYNPNRSRAVMRNNEISTWAEFLGAVHQVLSEQKQKHGAGFRILTETVTSPTMAAQIKAFLEKFPEARWHQYEPLNLDNSLEGTRLAFGRDVAAQYQLDKAEFIVSLDCDFLFEHPDRLRYARHFTDLRRIVAGRKQMNRLYVAESTPTITGSMAEHRLRIASRDIGGLALALARELGLSTGDAPLTKWLTAAARDLQAHRGAGLVIAGEQQPREVHALAHFMNDHLQNAGKTVLYTARPEAVPVNQLQSLIELVQDMDAGKVEALVIFGGNPLLNAPADLEFRQRLAKLKTAIHLSEWVDETSAACEWHIPQAHFLESWGDIRSFDGTATIQQPLIAPLYNGRAALELLDAIAETAPQRSAYQILRGHWQNELSGEFESRWRRALHDGLVEGTAVKPEEVALKSFEQVSKAIRSETHDLEIVFRPDPNLWDGRFAANAWLQELPRPITKVSWDNPVLVSPKLAAGMGLANGDVVQLEFGNRSKEAPVWITPGQAEKTVTFHVGNALRTAEAFWFGSGLTLKKTGRRNELASTQGHHSIPDPEREVLRSETFADFLNGRRGKHEIPESLTLYDPEQHPYTDHKWGMSIDLTTCIGCNACIVACQAENNIPVVGKEQVAKGREMLWLRVDTYFAGDQDNPSFHHQPVPCMHCETAPCEYVCPVEATVHDHEGLNLQVYNRCVGTRYCSNNCPYKVRRFNFLAYAENSPSAALRNNPEVTVRWRGVMEKCTYCIQRISAARIKSKEENAPIPDGAIQTACQQACPAEAIVFGDLNDKTSKVSKWKAHPLDYSMLGQLNTRPRTTYLAKLANPSDETG